MEVEEWERSESKRMQKPYLSPNCGGSLAGRPSSLVGEGVEVGEGIEGVDVGEEIESKIGGRNNVSVREGEGMGRTAASAETGDTRVGLTVHNAVQFSSVQYSTVHPIKWGAM